MAIKKKLTLELPDHINSLIDILGDSNPQIDHGQEKPEMKYGALPNQPTNVYGQPDEIQPVRSVLPTSQEQPDISGTTQFQESRDLLQPKSLPTNVQKPRTVYDELGDKLSHPVLRSEHEPSKMRKFAGALAGGVVGLGHGPEAGSKVAGGIVDQPYNEAYQDWLTETNALGTKANLDISRRKADTAGLNDYASYLKTLSDIDPNAQENLSRSKTRGEESAKEPGRVAEDTRTQLRDTELDKLVTIREKALEDIRQGGQDRRNEATIAGAAKRASELVHSREGIATAQRALREKLAKDSKNTRIPPDQQFLAQIIAENEMSKSFADANKFSYFYEETKDSNGKTGYRLKRDTEVPAKYKHEYDQQKELIERYKKKILGTGFDPKANSDDSDDDNDFDISIDELGG